MSVNSKQRRTVIITILLSAVVMRLVPHIPNFAPITAAAMFSAVYLPKRYLFIVPLAAAALSDYLLLYINPFGSPMINLSHVYAPGALLNNATAWVWASFMISALLGLLLRKKRSLGKIGFVSILASLQFFLISNFGVWAAGAYARNPSGLIESYVAGLPFLGWTIAGDAFYIFSFFALYAVAMNEYKTRAKNPKPAKSTAY